MADWKRLSKHLALRDGKIDRRTVEMLRAEFTGSGAVDPAELDFLRDLRRVAPAAVRELDALINDVASAAAPPPPAEE